MTSSPWWRGAAIYELYVQSFADADADGDGIGDLPGVRARLPYLAALGIDAIWFSPWYPSPRSDAGYDVADYRSIDPAFGTLDDADALIAEGHTHGIRTIIDIVPNHCSDQHQWFQAAPAAPPRSAERARFWFRPGRGPGGDIPPNGWQSIFGGPAWTRTTAPDGTPGEWYLHLFAPEQPDFNWANPEVRAEFEAILRFWFDRGVDGIRIDSAAMLTKDPRLPEIGPGDPSPFADRDDVHDIYRAWRAVAEQYSGRVLIGEIWLADATRFARYLRPDEMHTVFNFPYLCCPWDAAQLREVIDGTLAFHAAAGAPATWVLSNHDVDRHVSRYGRADTSFGLDRRDHSQPVDLASAPAGPGLPRCSRCFSPPDAAKPPWLPQPVQWRALTVQAQTGDPESMLELYRQALRIRRAEHALGEHPDTPMTWRPAPDGVLAFDRGDALCCIANLSAAPVPLPGRAAVLLASGPLAMACCLPTPRHGCAAPTGRRPGRHETAGPARMTRAAELPVSPSCYGPRWR